MSKNTDLKENLSKEEIDLERNGGSLVGNAASTVANLLSSHGNLRGSDASGVDNPASTIANLLSSNGNLRGSDDSSGIGNAIPNNSYSNLDNLVNSLKIDDNSDGYYPKMGNLRGSSFIDASKASFILGIISNWYLLVAVPAMTVTYNVFKSLQEQGILDSMYNQVYGVLQDMIKFSSECPQLIYDINKFVQCLGWK